MEPVREYFRSFLSSVYPVLKKTQNVQFFGLFHHIYHCTHFLKKLIYKKLVLGQLNGQEMFSTQAMEVKKLKIISFLFLLQFKSTATYLDTDMFKKESFPGTKFYS